MSRFSQRRSHSQFVMFASVLLLAFFAFIPTLAFAEPNDTLPGSPAPASPFSDAVSATGDLRDVYRFTLSEGQNFSVLITGSELQPGQKASVTLFGPTVTNLDDLSSAISTGTLETGHHFEDAFVIRAGQGGDYYACVNAVSQDATYYVTWQTTSPSVSLTPTSTAISVIKGQPAQVLGFWATWHLLPSESIPFAVDCDQPWLSAVPATGSADGYWDVGLGVRVDPNVLAPGTHEGTATVRLFGAEPRTFRVSVHVLDQPTMSIAASTARVNYGGKVTLSSALRSSSGGLMPGVQAALQRSYDGANWTTLTAPVSPSGAYSAVVAVDRKTRFRWVFPGATDITPCMSAEKIVESYASVGKPNAPTRLRPKRNYLVLGILKPHHANGSYPIQMQFQYYRRGKWRNESFARVKAFDYKGYSQYGYWDRYARGVPRRWRVRAIHSDADHLRTYSSWEYYSVY
jgi:hypothetical protein